MTKTIESLSDIVVARQHPGRIAFVEQTAYRTRKFAYAEVQKGARLVAASFQSLSIQSGDRVILWGENSARWAMTLYACVLTGVVAVPIDASFSQQFVDKIQQLTEAKYICSDRNPESWNRLFEKQLVDFQTTDLNDAKISSDALLEIIYTSGTTGEPKGVMITHQNVLSNLVPVHEEIQHYKHYAIPFSPLGFVHLIPLSHLFGQIMGLFIPQLIGGTVIFGDPAGPRVVETVKRHRASAVVCVPQELSMLSTYVRHRFKVEPEEMQKSGLSAIVASWWKYRRVHRAFGWKFWAFIVGGATLPVEEEKFWRRLGYAVIQGYGLTETAPSATISHPFKDLKIGSVGKKLPGVEIKIAEDGEILIRGPNVTPGYYRNDAATAEAFQDGWLRTGDIGRFDEDGSLRLLGRKKEVIVTADGLNVYPQDVEEVLNRDPRIHDSAVIGTEVQSRPQVHAVLVLEPQTQESEAPDVIRKTNARLENFQRIQSFSLWPEPELPRTSTGKLKRMAIARGAGSEKLEEGRRLDQIINELLSRGTSKQELQLDNDLGLTSLDRIELMAELERRTGIQVDERSFAEARTLTDVAKLVQKSNASGDSGQRMSFHQWAQWLPVRWFRTVARNLLVFPAMRMRMQVRVWGRENLDDVKLPVLFVANHQSLIDVAVILKALPRRFRSHLAPAMGTGRTEIEMMAAALFFNSYPLPRTSIGLRDAIRHTGFLADQGYCPIVFPEGERTPDGKLKPFRAGIGVIVKETQLPVVPIFLVGVFEVWPTQARGPSPGMHIVKVVFGRSQEFSGQNPTQITSELESWFQRKEAELG